MDTLLDLSLHHVGGRGGGRRFPVLPAFEGDMVNVLYEGDPGCIDEMEEASARLASRTIALADCVGEAPGTGTLKLFRDCGASSLLPIREDYKARFLALGWDGFDHQQSAFDVLGSVDVDLVSLDAVLERERGWVPAPDFLSLNVQGFELKIMRGAPRTLRDHTLALQTEVSLFEIYEGQAGLTEILRQAESMGFLAAEIFQLGGWVPSFSMNGKEIRPPVGMRLGGVALQADVLFFKDPKAILAHHADPQMDLVKAVFLAVALKNYSLSFAYGSLVDRDFLAALPRGKKRYIDFVAAYLDGVDRTPAIPAMDFIVTDHAMGDKPVGVEAVRRAYFQGTDRELFMASAPALLASEPTAVEAACLAFGLPRSAEWLGKARQDGMRGICQHLGLLAEDGKTLDPMALELL